MIDAAVRLYPPRHGVPGDRSHAGSPLFCHAPVRTLQPVEALANCDGDRSGEALTSRLGEFARQALGFRSS